MTSQLPLPALPRVALFGAGRVGTATAVLLQRSGCEIVGVWSRSESSVARAARYLRVGALDMEDRGTVDADLVLIGAGDTSISDVVEVLAGRAPAGAVAAHLSGSLGVEALRRLLDTGVHGLACHPVQACPDVDTAVARLPGSAWGVTTSEGIEGWALAFVSEKLHGAPVLVPEGYRPLWHTASVMTSNGIAALLAFGETLLASIGIERPEAVLGPLAAGTVDNARSGGGGGATLTGPVVRGESATIERHLDALREHSPELVADYVRVVEMILGAAVSARRVDEPTRRRIAGLLA
jgi:predicted short-subunit dehydrogenase-like oxidoreductase (DUF2520 family)